MDSSQFVGRFSLAAKISNRLAVTLGIIFLLGYDAKAQSKDFVRFTEIFADFQCWEGDCTGDDVAGKVTLTGYVWWDGPMDLSTFNATTIIDLSVGDLDALVFLGDDPHYTRGKKYATFDVEYLDYDDNPISAGELRLTWNDIGCHFALSVRTGSDSGYYPALAPTYYAPVFWDDTLAGPVAGSASVYLGFTFQDPYWIGNWEKYVPFDVTGNVWLQPIQLDGNDYNRIHVALDGQSPTPVGVANIFAKRHRAKPSGPLRLPK